MLGSRFTDEETRRQAADDLVKVWSQNPKIDLAAMENAFNRLATDPTTGELEKLGARTLAQAIADRNKRQPAMTPSQRQ